MSVVRKLLFVAFGSLIFIESYYQIAFRAGGILPSSVRLYDFRYFDAQGTPRYPAHSEGWYKSYQGRPDIKIQINAEGIRGDELLARPDFRIALIGDSTVFNGAVRYDETFPYLLQQDLRTQTGDPAIEALNLGVSDTNIRQYYLKLKNHALALKPDLALVFIYLNDAIDSAGTAADTSNRGPTLPWYHSFALEQLSKLFRNFYILFEAVRSDRFTWVSNFQSRRYLHDPQAWQRMIADAQYDWGSAWHEQAWKTIEQWVVEILRISNEAGVPVQFVIMPLSAQVELPKDSPEYNRPQQFAREMAKRQGMILHDPLPYLRARSDRALLYYDQCHFTERGNVAMSEYLLTELIRALPERLRE